MPSNRFYRPDAREPIVRLVSLNLFARTNSISCFSFSLMEDVAKYTRLNPRERIAKLLKFNERLQTTIESVKNFEDWNTKLDRQMLQLEGRQLAAETIYFGQERQ